MPPPSKPMGKTSPTALPTPMVIEHTREDLEAAVTLLQLSRGPVHSNRRSGATALEDPSVEGQPPRKKVRIVLPSDDATAPSEPERGQSVEYVGSCPAKGNEPFGQYHTSAGKVGEQFRTTPFGSRVKVEQKKTSTFKQHHAYAKELAKRCQQPLAPLGGPTVTVGSTMLPATGLGRHANSNAAGLIPTTSFFTNTNTNANANANKNTAQADHKMDGFWQDDVAHHGFMPTGLSPQPGMQPSVNPMQVMFPEGQFVDQADVNKALFSALHTMQDNYMQVATSNEQLYAHVSSLRGRVKTLEEENQELRALVEGRGKQRPPTKLNLTMSNLDLNNGLAGPGNMPTPSTSALSGTTLAFPSRPTTGTGVAFPTTVTSFSSDDKTTAFSMPAAVPPTPTAPGSRTVLYKKDKHDLTAKLPPANCKFPLVPLTDVELIVFFYNSTSRPIVSVRLYARGGPNVIAKVINEHRIVNPDGYKRNTCSVHCNKAVKMYIKANGDEWKKTVSDFFERCGDVEATNAIRHQPAEMADACDFPVLEMFKDLIKFPDAAQSGIFTQCVQWCQDNQVDAMVSEVHLIAHALQNGIDPREILDAPDDYNIDVDVNMVVAKAEGTSRNELEMAERVRRGQSQVPGGAAMIEDSDSELTTLSESEFNAATPAKFKKAIKIKAGKKPSVKAESPDKA